MTALLISEVYSNRSPSNNSVSANPNDEPTPEESQVIKYISKAYPLVALFMQTAAEMKNIEAAQKSQQVAMNFDASIQQISQKWSSFWVDMVKQAQVNVQKMVDGDKNAKDYAQKVQAATTLANAVTTNKGTFDTALSSWASSCSSTEQNASQNVANMGQEIQQVAMMLMNVIQNILSAA